MPLSSTARSSALTPASLWSVFAATLSSSAGSVMRSAASSAVRASPACRAIELSAFRSVTRPTASARTDSTAEDFAMDARCF